VPGLFTEEQDELRSSARRFLEEKSSSETVRKLMDDEAGFDEAVWRQMAGLGWMGMAIPEEYGGSGFSFTELGILLEEMGRVLLPSPFLATAGMAAFAVLQCGSEIQKKKVLTGIADGSVRATMALVEESGSWAPGSARTAARRDGDGYLLTGAKMYVIDGHLADLLVVSAQRDDGEGIGLFLVESAAAGVKRTAMTTLDMTRKQARIDFDGAAAELLENSSPETLSKSLDLAAIALASEMVGGAEKCLETAVEYANTRIQFGRLVGSFQAIKHKCANVLTEVEMAKSAAYYAAWAASEAPDEITVAACIAKAYASDAFFVAAAENVQIHGGIGFTWEHDAHLYLRRAKSSEIYLGDASYHRELLVQRIGV
jgi:alkylation response protein AidB-like acyl-CoA dehydrogenase